MARATTVVRSVSRRMPINHLHSTSRRRDNAVWEGALAAPAVRRIQLRAARELEVLTATHHELVMTHGRPRRRLLLAWAVVLSEALELSVADDLVATWRDIELTHAPVRVAQAQAETELGFTVTADTRPPRSVVSSAPLRGGSTMQNGASEGCAGPTCSGDPFDPMNFCL